MGNPHNQNSILYRLQEQGKILNPVIGLSIGGKNPRLTVGALDPDDYDGEINWVEAQVDPAFALRSVIQIDALKGHQGNVLSGMTFPVNALLDTSRPIFVISIPGDSHN